MTTQQRNILSYVLNQLDYPFLSKHAITSDPNLCESYANLAKFQSEAKHRFDLVAEMSFYKLI